jgi:hypothetical protein
VVYVHAGDCLAVAPHHHLVADGQVVLVHILITLATTTTTSFVICGTQEHPGVS